MKDQRSHLYHFTILSYFYSKFYHSFILLLSFNLSYKYYWYRQLRARRALLQIKDVPLRTRRALSPYTLYSNSALLVLNRTSLKCNNALLALNWRYAAFTLSMKMLWGGPSWRSVMILIEMHSFTVMCKVLWCLPWLAGDIIRDKMIQCISRGRG